MSAILIDTNIYLEFYASAKLQGLLPLITKVKDHIFVSTQIVFEVRRNQLSQAKRFLEQSYVAKAPKLNVPQHLVNLPKELNERIDTINNSANAIVRELEGAYSSALMDIAQSRDKVSQALSVLFEQAWEPSKEELANARLRKELGNPPGKQGDPLGDQLTWEQFLSRAPGKQRFWIITKDNDYCEEVLGATNPVLVPFLYNELMEKCQHDVDVRCFRTLADGLKDFSKTHDVAKDAVPADAVLEEIKKEEQKVIPLVSNLFDPSPTSSCPRCSKVGTLIFGGCSPSVYGGWTLKHRCRACGFQIDTGEYCDD